MANQGKREWFIKLVNSRTKKWINDDTGAFQVYTAGTPSRVQINDAAGADVSQDVPDLAGDFTAATLTDGTLRFWTARSVSTVDVSILTAGGRAYFLDGIKSSEHRVDVDPDAQNFVLVVALDDRASSTNIRKLGFTLAKGMVINDVLINVTGAFTGAALASCNYNLGRSGTVQSFWASAELSATGLKQQTVFSTTGLVILDQEYGSDLITFSTGGAAATQQGWIMRVPYVVATATATNRLTAQRLTAATLTGTIAKSTVTSGKAYVYYLYTLLPSMRASDNLKSA